MTKAAKAERDEYIGKLRAMLKPGDTVYTILRSVSRSGMYRTMDVHIIRDNEPLRLTYWVAKAIGARYDDKREALGIGGCGMDVGFEVVYNLGRTLWPDGFDCIGKGKEWRDNCPSNDHSNDGMSGTPEVLRYSPDRHHNDGGYALRHRWIG